MNRRLAWMLLPFVLAMCAVSSNEDATPRAVSLTAPQASLERLRARFPVLGSVARDASPSVTVTLPARAGGLVSVTDDVSGLRVAFALRGATDAPGANAGDISVYANGVASGDVLYRVRPTGAEDFVAFESRPPVEQLVYDVDVSHVAGLRLVGGVLELVDARGAPRLRANPPFVVETNGARTPATLTVEGCAIDTSSAPPYGRPPTAPGAASCTVRVAWSGVSYPALVDPQWVTTQSMIGKAGAATLLATGRVLFTDGTPQLYDPDTGTFSATGPMVTSRTESTATLLASNEVLVAGGVASSSAALSSAELYDPGTGAFASTGAMTAPRALHTATLLANGKVLLAGGLTSATYAFPPLPNATQLSSAELYDPAAGKFTATGPMSVPRAWHTATRLPSGSVLVVGGFYENSSGLGIFPQVAEVYSPSSGTFITTGTTSAVHEHHLAIPLPSGSVLVAGGGYLDETQEGVYFDFTAASEIYNPASGVFSTISNMNAARGSAAAATLPSGRLLVAGGATGTSTLEVLSTTEIFDPATQKFAAATSLPAACGDGFSQAITATALPSGLVLVTCDTAAFLYTLDNGHTCTSSTQCLSGFCVDGVCCDTACTGQCQACDVGGEVGVCSAVASGPSHGTRAPCTCDNGQCSNHQCSDPHTSVSTDGGVSDCAPYLCGSTGFCLDSCASVSDCLAPNVCNTAGHCVAPPSGGGGGCEVSHGRAPLGAAWPLALALLGRFIRRGKRRS